MCYREAIDEILSQPYDFTLVKPCIESKVFGIGVEAYTAGSAEFALSCAAFNRDKCIPLMDNGHYHPTEVVSDKIPALLSALLQPAAEEKAPQDEGKFTRLMVLQEELKTAPSGRSGTNTAAFAACPPTANGGPWRSNTRLTCSAREVERYEEHFRSAVPY